jgi:hypothetical protein
MKHLRFILVIWKIDPIIFSGIQENSTPLPSTFPKRVIIHGHHPNETTGDTMGKLINLPDSTENLFDIAGI